MASLIRYKEHSAHERIVYRQLYNAPSSIERDTKYKRTKVIEPRYQICCLFNESNTLNSLKHERITYESGLYTCFLIHCPLPPFICAETIRKAPRIHISMSALLFFIHVFHFEACNRYSFTSEASEMLATEYDSYKLKTQLANEHDGFLG